MGKTALLMRVIGLFLTKGQVHSVDFIVSGVIFITIFLSLVVFWDDVRFSFEQEEKANDLELVTAYALESLMTHPGEPYNWSDYSSIDAEKISSLGLTTGRYGHFDKDKVAALNHNESYEDIKTLLGVRGPGYEFKLNVKRFNSSYNVTDSWEIGYMGECEITSQHERLASGNANDIYRIILKGCVT